ncbi:hypothetical protein Pint_36258 [Pistacia integerrima]|uniref:Uncharacterized protein n=1 Tax=Pistacia integerrima TaxID=434235 RepID=A0ACC0Y2G3_9ROSI|nr:hypothetical protein Pint_36258 [Pistacia integerrima]
MNNTKTKPTTCTKQPIDVKLCPFVGPKKMHLTLSAARPKFEDANLKTG